ncbi:MAG: ComEC/Rec2 family competence protein [Patescibacteria group bacterium]|nr:ComEC/Rec2 family competence protein [Patescibacteria group bacterium]
MNYFSRSKIFLYILISFVIGIFLGSYIGSFLVGLSLIVILLNCYIVVFLLIIFRKKKLLLCFFVLLLSCFLGIWRYQSYLPKIDKNHIGFYVDNKETYLITGIVDAEPAEKDSSLQLQISQPKFLLENELHSVIPVADLGGQANIKSLQGKILLTVPKYYEVNYGDEVQFSAKLAKPTKYDSFDYESYLARYGVYAIAKSVDGFEVVVRGCRDTLQCVSTGLYKIKNYFSSVIQKIYPEPHGSFMLGLLIGAKKGLPDWLVQVFQVIGITHIIAISGYNITILAKVAEKTLGKIGRKYIFWGVLAMIVSFVIMTGAAASIVRAGIMGGLLVYAGFIGRRGSALNVLVLAGTIMIFLNPLILRNDIGFQLSFLATLGLVFISPIFESWSKKKPPATYYLLLTTTLAAQVLTLPIIISSFGRLSLISPVANVIILGFIPLAMFLGFLSGGFGMLWLPLGKIVGFLGYIVLDVIIKISGLLSRVPYASLELKINSWWVWGGYYAVVSLGIFLWYRRNKKTKS